jgi:hypothetical protein
MMIAGFDMLRDGGRSSMGEVGVSSRGRVWRGLFIHLVLRPCRRICNTGTDVLMVDLSFLTFARTKASFLTVRKVGSGMPGS